MANHLGALRSLSSLLRAAVHDAQEVEKLKQYRLQMHLWHAPAEDGVCLVCLAGSVMVQRLGVSDPKTAVGPNNFRDLTERKLFAIDQMRGGSFETAYGTIWPEPDYLKPTRAQLSTMRKARDIIRDDVDEPARGRVSWETYIRAADVLQAAGL